MSAPLLSAPSGNLAQEIQGVWWLLSREDWNKEGERRVDPVLGADPIGILTYTPGHFAAQFMKRDRSSDPAAGISYSGQNNTVAVGGYDAYFGTYTVDEKNGQVAHTLIGSITQANMGITVLRHLRVTDNKLLIQLDTTTPDGESITRTLTWERLA